MMDSTSHQLGWRMAVLPFRSVGMPIGHGLALGMAEEVSAALSRFRAPRVIATATFWNGAEPLADALAQCRTYQLDYVIDGTMQVVGNDVRVNVTLLDVVLDFEVIWAKHFDGRLDDLFSLQHRIASETVAQIDPEILQRATVHGIPAQTENAAAHHAVLSAIQGIFRLDRPLFMQARELLVQGTELDPDYAAAHAWLAYWSIMAVGHGWAENAAEVTTHAGASADRAVLLDPLDARALAIAGHVKAYLFHDVRGALHLHARAIELNPNLPIAWTFSSWSKIYNGEHATAIQHATTAKSLSPRDPAVLMAEHAIMTALFFARQLEEADSVAEGVLERDSRHVSVLNIRLGILGHLKRSEEARLSLEILRSIDPAVTVSKIAARAPFRPYDRAYYIEGLRRSGVPETLPPAR